MGNLASTATKGQDGYYYMNLCPQGSKDCPPSDPYYKVFNKNATVIPIVSNPTDNSVLLKKSNVDENVMEDKDKFIKGWYYLDTHDNVNLNTIEKDLESFKPPNNACVRIDPCDGAVKQHGICCPSTVSLPTAVSIASKPANSTTTETSTTGEVKLIKATTGTTKSVVASEKKVSSKDDVHERVWKRVRIGVLIISCVLLMLVIAFMTFTMWPATKEVNSSAYKSAYIFSPASPPWSSGVGSSTTTSSPSPWASASPAAPYNKSSWFNSRY